MKTDMKAIEQMAREFLIFEGDQEPGQEPDWSKLDMGNDAKFGSPVMLVAPDGSSQRGYLTTLPGHDDAEWEGIVHFPDDETRHGGFSSVYAILLEPETARLAIGQEEIEYAELYAEALANREDEDDDGDEVRIAPAHRTQPQSGGAS